MTAGDRNLALRLRELSDPPVPQLTLRDRAPDVAMAFVALGLLVVGLCVMAWVS